MINMKDYELAYNTLDSEFKAEKFNTLEKFKEYVQNEMFAHNKIKYEAYSNQMSPIYIYKIILKDATNENDKQYNYKILVKLLEKDNFKMSFSQE